MNTRPITRQRAQRNGSLFVRTALFSLSVVILTLTAFGLRFIAHEKQTLYENLETRAKLLAVSLDRSVSNALAESNVREALNECLDTLRCSEQAVYISFNDGSGKIWLQTHGGTTTIDAAREGQMPSLLPDHSGKIGYSSLMRREVLHYHHPLTRLPNFAGYLQVGLDVEKYRAGVRELIVEVLGLGIPGLLIGLLASFLFARYLTKPIADLETFAAKVASGDLDSRVHLRSRTEIGRLGDAMNQMTAEIQESQSALERLVELEKRVSAAGAELTKLGADDLDRGIDKTLHDMAHFLHLDHYAFIQELDGESRFSGHGHNFDFDAPLVISNLQSLCFSDRASLRSELLKHGYLQFTTSLHPKAKTHCSVIALPLGDAQAPSGMFCLVHQGEIHCSEHDVRVLLLLGKIIHNLIQRRESERERVSLLESLNQSQRLEAIGKLSGGIAHDFNNMLVPIIGYSDVILDSADLAARHREEILEIRKAAESAASLTRQLLAFSRKQILQKSRLDINATIDQLQSRIRRTFGDDIALRLDLEPAIWAVDADRSQLEQVLMNLFANARDAMIPQGGEITVRSRNVHRGGKSADEPSGDFVTITVEDHGTGIDRQVLDRIFDPFYSTKGRRGTGLGLSVVLGIVDQHGGWINVESEPGKGSAFTIHLPATAQPFAEARGESIHVESRSEGANREHVFVIDDEPGVLAFVEQALKRAGYRVTTASSFAQALAVYEERGGEFDLVLTDAVLPDGTGMEILEKVLDLHPTRKVLLSSGYTDARASLEKTLERRVPFLQKPYSLAELYAKVSESVKTERPGRCAPKRVCPS